MYRCIHYFLMHAHQLQVCGGESHRVSTLMTYLLPTVGLSHEKKIIIHHHTYFYKYVCIS